MKQIYKPKFHFPNLFETFISDNKLVDLNQLHQQLIASRERRRLNKSQVAARLGISSQLYGQYEQGMKVPKANFFLKWKEVFGEDLMKLLETNVSHGTLVAEDQADYIKNNPIKNPGDVPGSEILQAKDEIIRLQDRIIAMQGSEKDQLQKTVSDFSGKISALTSEVEELKDVIHGFAKFFDPDEVSGQGLDLKRKPRKSGHNA